MFIDTHSKESMVESICSIFHLSHEELIDTLNKVNQTEADYDDYLFKLNNLIVDRTMEYPDEILLFHLSRRLHGTEDDTCGRNLADLLTTKNEFSGFMKRAGIEFTQGKNHIEVTYKGKEIDWDKCRNGNSNYMKLRLGYYKGREDFCFNGFAFKDLLYRNVYARSLSDVPEFLGQLIECLECKSLGYYFMEHSEYYCYEYRLPINLVLFDGNDEYSLCQKQHHLIRCVLQRLVDYHTCDSRYNYDYDNPILRLPDDYTVPSEYFVKKEKINYDMLQC